MKITHVLVLMTLATQVYAADFQKVVDDKIVDEVAITRIDIAACTIADNAGIFVEFTDTGLEKFTSIADQAGTQINIVVNGTLIASSTVNTPMSTRWNYFTDTSGLLGRDWDC